MRLFGYALIGIILTLIVAMGASASPVTNPEIVRLMCTATDNQDFSIFNPAELPAILIDLIRNDPPDAPLHERVVQSALKALGTMHVAEAVPVLIEKIPEYSTICIFWLGTFADPAAVNALVGSLDDEDASVRCEAADALGRVPAPDKDAPDRDYVQSLIDALTAVAERVGIEEDDDVKKALETATLHLMDLVLEPGTAQGQ